MTTVFISSGNISRDIMPLFELLSCGAYVSAVFEGFTSVCSRADYLLLPLKKGVFKTDSDCAAVVFEDSSMLSELPSRCSVLCFCDKAAARCSGSERQLISCGMHSKDTVTLSSTEKGKPVLSVQRRLMTFCGEAVEAGDYPLITSNPNHRALMAAAVLFLLSGRELPPCVFKNQSSTTDPVPFSI